MSKTREITFSCGEFRTVPNRNNTMTLYVEDPNTEEIFSKINEVDLTTYVSDNFEVDAVFSDEQLNKWAEDHGYTKG